MSADTTSSYALLSSLLKQLQTARQGRTSSNDQVTLRPEFFADLKQLIGVESLEVEEKGERVDILSLAVNTCSNQPALLEKLYYSLKAIKAAQEEKDREKGGNRSAVVIHNRQIAEKLQENYNSKTFAELFDLCRSKGVFALRINETSGLVATAEAEENWDMSGRQWVTDTVRCGDIERSLDAPAWRKAMLTLCDFYNGPQEVEAINNSIADPNYYRQGGLLNGVAHIFIPHSLKRDESWFNNKRLESHGLALKAICDTVLHSQSQPWGFSGEELKTHGPKIARTIVLLASYLKAINSRPTAGDKAAIIDFAAPSAGPWEEIPFPEGLTWDTEAVRSGFESLHSLLNNPRYAGTKNIVNMRQLVRSENMASWLAEEDPSLETLLRLARGKIIDRLFGQELPMENPHRPLDASLAFITTSTIALADDQVEDIALHIKLLQVLEEKLVRGHGIIRYAPFDLPVQTEAGTKVESVFDSYLADNYWLMPALRSCINKLGNPALLRDWGSSDCSSHEDYVSRVKLARQESEAQWCFVSVMAEGYLRQVEKLIVFNLAASHRDLLSLAVSKASEFLNRSFARITATDMVKANGRPCPAWAIPEAYEMVSPGFDETAAAGLFALPGANTPLAWGQASLFSACTLFQKLLPQIEEFTLN